MRLATTSSRLARVLRSRDLSLLLAADLVSQTGDWILGVGVAYEVYALTGSTLASAALLLATQVPNLLLASPAGVLVDRRDRRRTMIAVDLALAAVLTPLLLVRGADDVWVVVAVVAASSCLEPFFLAAEASLLPALVEPDLLVTANAVNGQVRDVARLIGAALGGLLAAAGGFVLIALADMATFAVAAVLLAVLRHRAAPAAAAAAPGARLSLEGFAAVRRDRALVAVLTFFLLSGVGEGVMGTLFAPFVRDVLGGSAAVYGAILAAQAIGGIAAGLLVSAFGHRFAARSLFGWGAILFGLLDLALFLSPLASHATWPAIVLIALVGLPGAAMSAGVLTVFQLGTTDGNRGRVFGVLLTAQSAAMLAGTAGAGILALPLGVLPVVVVQAVVYTAGGLVALVLLRPARA
ncbi:MFS transporter [Amnibacterium sp. CER49]|uniref:MFS transporter n=1 Tax=Amnibacterium sp. CER49 TaxID=3039161 RepID=UPI00244A164B|nr:MFS transporter [Amnibacterium sp. CER49]MDH2445414.1 MFS transporter [Amnibacterium sp. CER49]